MLMPSLPPLAPNPAITRPRAGQRNSAVGSLGSAPVALGSSTGTAFASALGAGAATGFAGSIEATLCGSGFTGLAGSTFVTFTGSGFVGFGGSTLATFTGFGGSALACFRGSGFTGLALSTTRALGDEAGTAGFAAAWAE